MNLPPWQPDRANTVRHRRASKVPMEDVIRAARDKEPPPAAEGRTNECSKILNPRTIGIWESNYARAR